MTNVNRLESVEPDPQEISQFWAYARKNVGWAGLEVILGQQQDAIVEPPWMHLSSDAEEATQLVNAIAQAGKGVVQTPLSAFPEGDEDLPSPGDLAIICNGEGKPVALVMTVNVDVVDVQAGDGDPDSPQDGNGVRIVEEKFRSLYPRMNRKTQGNA